MAQPMKKLALSEEQASRLRPITVGVPLRSFPLIGKETLVEADKDVLPVRRFTFGYPSGRCLGFNLGRGECLKIVVPGITKPRSYSPTSDPSREGSFDLTIKIYKGGRCSEWLDSLSLGQPVRMIGPLPLKPALPLYNPGTHVVIIALGVGITEGFPVLAAELERDSNVKVTLVHALRYERECIFVDEIQNHVDKYGDRFEMKRVFSREKVESCHKGHVDATFLHKCAIDEGGHKTRFLVVGTKEMIRSVWASLKAAGYSHRKHALLRKPLKPMLVWVAKSDAEKR